MARPSASYGIAMPISAGRFGLFPLHLSGASIGRPADLRDGRSPRAGHSLIAAFQAMEAMKILSGQASQRSPHDLHGRSLERPMRESPCRGRDPDCPACVRRDLSSSTAAAPQSAYVEGTRCRFTNAAGRWRSPKSPTRLKGLGTVRANEFALRFHAGNHEITLFPDGRAIIKGTTDIGVARGIYSRYIGN